MYTRKTKTADHGKDSYTYRIVESVRVGTHVKQCTLLNLGKDFAIESMHWPLLAARIKQFLQGSSPYQSELFALADDVGHPRPLPCSSGRGARQAQCRLGQ